MSGGNVNQNSDVELTCSDNVKKILCEALRNYAQEVLPDITGGHYQVSRGDLLETVDEIEKSLSGKKQFAIIRNTVMPECKAAIYYHYKSLQQTLNMRVDEQRQLMLDVLHGICAEDTELDNALHKDEVM